MNKNVLAFDFGASSGRAIVGEFKDNHLTLHEVHRFTNYPITTDEGVFWDLENLMTQIQLGIKKATAAFPIVSLGIDTWGVDFGLIGENGEVLGNPHSYRDTYTQGILAEVAEHIPLAEIYQKTGNQLMEINTLFQLLALKKQSGKLFKKAKNFLLMSDLMNYLLTGVVAAEKTIASTTQMLNPVTKAWEVAFQDLLEVAPDFFPPLVSAGHFLGWVKDDFSSEKVKVYNICQHDTASAVASIPNLQDFLFVSCGTWSLVGTELAQPIITEKAYNYNLTNETGINDTTRFLKNCTGLWMIQELKRNWEEAGKNYTYEEITTLAQGAPAFSCLVDTDDPIFATPGDMISRLQDYAKKTAQPLPTTDGQLARCVYESLAMKYKYTFLEISDACEKDFPAVNMVGGGANAEILCQMVADASGLPVYAGPVEATAIGNIAVQLMAEGVFSSLEDFRQWLKENHALKTFYPSEKARVWDQEFSRYQKLLEGVGC